MSSTYLSVDSTNEVVKEVRSESSEMIAGLFMVSESTRTGTPTPGTKRCGMISGSVGACVKEFAGDAKSGYPSSLLSCCNCRRGVQDDRLARSVMIGREKRSWAEMLLS